MPIPGTIQSLANCRSAARAVTLLLLLSVAVPSTLQASYLFDQCMNSPDSEKTESAHHESEETHDCCCPADENSNSTESGDEHSESDTETTASAEDPCNDDRCQTEGACTCHFDQAPVHGEHSSATVFPAVADIGITPSAAAERAPPVVHEKPAFDTSPAHQPPLFLLYSSFLN